MPRQLARWIPSAAFDTVSPFARGEIVNTIGPNFTSRRSIRVGDQLTRALGTIEPEMSVELTIAASRGRQIFRVVIG
jgi:hypothetical protein